MTASLLGGGYNYQSPETRALGDFAADKFAYRDQGKNIIQLNNAVGFMSGMMRKMQRGIDDANKNFVQQIQGFITDFIVLLGGGGDTGLDFGDLKYVIQAVGALFGFADADGNITVPVNLFNAAWHFFTNYIGITGNFKELIDQLIDNAIATILDLFGEVPIVGQALQQFFVIVSDIRDLLTPVADALQTLFEAFDINIGDINGITDFFGPFKPIMDAIFEVLDIVELPDLSATIGALLQLTAPFVDQLANVIKVIANIIKLLTGSLSFTDFGSITDIFTVFPQMIYNLIFNGGLFNLNNLPFFPVSNLTNTTPNLLTAPGFDDSGTVRFGTGWSYDSSIGKTTPGCVKLSANGIVRELISNNITVQPGDVINLSIWNRWLSLAYSGTAQVSLGVTTYYATVKQGTAQITTQTISNPSQTTWQQINGTYTVPATGVDAIALRVVVNPTIANGSMWFDDGSVTKTQTTIPQGWVGGLLDSLGGLGDFIQGLLDTFIGVVRGIPFVGGTLAGLLENFTGQTNVITTTSATTNQILAALGPGNPDADDFERMNTTSPGPKWTVLQSGPGTVSTANGHDLSFLHNALTDSEFMAISNVLALGNIPQGAVVLANAPGAAADLPFIPASAFGSNDIWVKVENTFTTWANRTGLRCRIDSAKNIRIDWYQNGTPTNIYVGTFTVAPTSGASFSFESGVGGVNRRHVAKLGGAPILDYTETGTVSQFGPGYLRRALGGKITHSIFNPASPASVQQWTAQG